jgi:hypothetical protein
MSEQAVNRMPCPTCQKAHCVEAEQYDRIITECGQKWFVLRPKRFGPLVMRPHPGENLTRAELAAKYGGKI